MLSGIKVYYNGLPKSGKVKFVLTLPFRVVFCGFIIVVIFVSDLLSTFFSNISDMTYTYGQYIGDRLCEWYDPTDE